MSTLTIELSDDLAARLTAASELTQVAPAEFVTATLERTLPSSSAGVKEPSLYESMRDGFGCVDSGVTDLATNPKYLAGYGRSRQA